MLKTDLEKQVAALTSAVAELKEQLAERERHASALDADLRCVETALATEPGISGETRARFAALLAERDERHRAAVERERIARERRRARLGLPAAR